MSRAPDLVQLLGDDVPPEDFERMRRAHDLLVAAGPPPELTPELERAPVPGRAGAGEGRGASEPAAVAGCSRSRSALPPPCSSSATSSARAARTSTPTSPSGWRRPQRLPSASAVIDVGEIDDSGNWPLRMKVRGLPEQPERAYYELFLTRNGKPAASCGTFRVHEGTTEVRLNAPYRFSQYDGWIIKAGGPGAAETGPLLEVKSV